MNPTFDNIKQPYDVIVVIPIGPGSSADFIGDTISSYQHYTRSTYKIILADDSQQGIANNLKAVFQDADILCTPKAMGGWAGLYITLSLAYSHAIKHYTFTALLKLDTDALIIAPEPEKEAMHLFKHSPDTGIAGQYPDDYYGQPWDIEWPKRRVLNATRTWKYIRRPLANLKLIRLYGRALKNHYRTGESVFGGAYFMSERLLIQLSEAGLLPNHLFDNLNLGEDHLFSLLAKANGFNLGDMSSGNRPFGCAWKGLPASPEQLCNDGKKIIHSVRYWQNLNEPDIRAFFKARRIKHHML